MSLALMRMLESAPMCYDKGISILTLGRLGRLRDWLVAHVQPGMRVLDMGTGTGALALMAASRGADVVAIDVNPTMLDLARRKADAAGQSERITWRELGVAEIDCYPARSFDVVTAGLFLSELDVGERRFALTHAWRLLDGEGRLLLLNEARPEKALPRLIHALIRIPLAALSWAFTKTSTRALPDLPELLEQAGFEVVARRSSLLGSLVAVIAGPSRRKT